jgi:hypothetical protein
MSEPKITAEPTVAYERGRGGAQWPTTRYAACVDGKPLSDKRGRERKFKTKEAALKAARDHVAKGGVSA